MLIKMYVQCVLAAKVHAVICHDCFMILGRVAQVDETSITMYALSSLALEQGFWLAITDC